MFLLNLNGVKFRLRSSFDSLNGVLSSTVPFSTPSTSAASGVTLEAITAQLQRMEAEFGGCLNYLTDEMSQMNTRVSRIACRQARMVGFAPSPSPL